MSRPDTGVYDAAPEEYDAFQSQFFEHGSPNVAKAYQGMFEALDLCAGQKLLEVGVGTGLNLRNYPPGVQAVGVDRSAPMLAVAQRRLSEVAARVELIETNAEKLPFDDQTFDRTVCTFVLCSCDDPKLLIGEMLRTTKVGGKLALFDFHKASTNQALLADQFLLRETLLRGIVSQGRAVAVCDTFYDLNEHLPADRVEVVFDLHLEGGIAEAFRATTIKRIA